MGVRYYLHQQSSIDKLQSIRKDYAEMQNQSNHGGHLEINGGHFGFSSGPNS